MKIIDKPGSYLETVKLFKKFFLNKAGGGLMLLVKCWMYGGGGAGGEVFRKKTKIVMRGNTRSAAETAWLLHQAKDKI